jgi:hypothetical protein
MFFIKYKLINLYFLRPQINTHIIFQGVKYF